MSGVEAQREQLPRSINPLKLIFLTLIQLAKQVWLLPQSVSNAVQQRRQQAVLNELEAEQFDRIRNPLKYLRQES
jgi:hypothetical protein